MRIFVGLVEFDDEGALYELQDFALALHKFLHVVLQD